MAEARVPILVEALPTPPRLQGYLQLDCLADSSGRSGLHRKAFKAPVHLSKPYWNGSALLVNVMCPTAGMLGGDRVDVEVKVGAGARLILSNPSALRIHKMESEDRAHWEQRFTVSRGAFLEVNPEWLILQAASAFDQHTHIELEQGAELFFIEAVAPGRVAHGEQFAFRSFRNQFRLRYGERLAALEQHAIEPTRHTHLAWSAASDSRPFYVSIHMASPSLDDEQPLWQELQKMQNPRLRIGSSRLAADHCWNVKLLAADSMGAKQAIAVVRKAFYAACGVPLPHLRRQ